MEENKNTPVMREVGVDDLFMATNVINKIGMDKLKKCLESDAVRKAVLDMMGDKEGGDKTSDTIANVGMVILSDVADIVLKSLPDIKHDLYALIAGVYNMDVKEIGKLKPALFVKMVKGFIMSEELKDFFTELFGSQG